MKNIFYKLILIICFLVIISNITYASSSSTISVNPISTLNIEIHIEKDVEISNDNLSILLDCGKNGIFEYNFNKENKTKSKEFSSTINVSCKLKADTNNHTLDKYEFSFGDDQGADNNYISGTPAKEFNGKKLWLKIISKHIVSTTTSSTETVISNTESSNSSESSSIESDESSQTDTSSESSYSITSKTTESSSKSISQTTKTSKSSSKTSHPTKSSSSKSSTTTRKSSSSTKSTSAKSSTKTATVKGASTLAKTGADVNQENILLLIIFTTIIPLVAFEGVKIFSKKSLPRFC